MYRDAANAAVRFLLENQRSDGTWCDYALPVVGASDAWTTSLVGVAMARSKTLSDSSLLMARMAVASLRRSSGWGYNALTATDADSTAWAVRLLRARDAFPLLIRYLDQAGRARTFLDPRYGTWAHTHPDVTPLVGLALLTIGGPRRTIKLVVDACLRSQAGNGAWRSFWWATDTYATARNLEFLRACGESIPEDTAKAAVVLLSKDQPSKTSFESAQRLQIGYYLGMTGEPLVADVLVRQLPDGSWPASNVLLQRAQAGGPETPPFADNGRLVSTASSLSALLTVSEHGL